jgi:hypothetical protein
MAVLDYSLIFQELLYTMPVAAVDVDGQQRQLA